MGPGSGARRGGLSVRGIVSAIESITPMLDARIMLAVVQCLGRNHG
jgi:hypothetical protein